METIPPRKLMLLAAAGLILQASALGGCSSCRKPQKVTKEPPDQENKAAKENPDKAKMVHTAGAPILPEAEISDAKGEFKVVRYEKKSAFPIAKDDRSNLYIGDRVVTEPGSEVEVTFTQGGKAVLKGQAEMAIGTHLPGEIVFVYGRAVIQTAELKGRTRRIKIQTPGGTFFHSGPESEIVVARSGATRIYVKDCPSPTQENKKEEPLRALSEEPFGCSYIAGGEETPLWSGDLLIVDAKLGEIVKRGYKDSSVMSGEWLIEEDKSFADERNKKVEWFAKWLQAGIDKLDETLTAMEKMRLDNKSYIEQLKAIREQTKTEGGGQSESNMSESDGKKMDDIKLKLAENSKQMARMREVLLARWYQLSLRWHSLQEFMTDEVLAKVKKDRSVMEAFITSYDEKILQIVKRRPRRSMPSKFPVPSYEKIPLAPHLKKIQPTAPTPPTPPPPQ